MRWIVALMLVVGPSAWAAMGSPAKSTNGSFTLTWDHAPVQNWLRYEIYESVNGGAFTEIAEFTGHGHSMQISGRSPGVYGYAYKTCYEYNAGTVYEPRWKIACGYTVNVPPAETTTTVVPNPTGAINGPSSSTIGTYTLTWTAPSNAVSGTKYRLQEKVGGGSYVTVQETSSLSWTTPSARGSAVHSYRVASCLNGQCSAFGSVKSVNVKIKPSVPGAIQGPAENSSGGYTLSWAKSSTGLVEWYELEERKNGTLQGVINVTPPSPSTTPVTHELTGKTNGTWSYKVKACNSLICSAYTSSKSVYVERTPSTPGPITGPASSNAWAFDLVWGPSSGSVHHYESQRRVHGTSSWGSPTTIGAPPAATSVPADGIYDYRIRACNSLGSCSGYNAATAVIVMKKPDISQLTIDAPEFSVTGVFSLGWEWDDDWGQATEFVVFERVNGGPWPEQPTYENGTPTGWSPPAAKAPGTYDYVVEACNEVGCSDPSHIVTVHVANLVNIEPPEASAVLAADAVGTPDYSVSVDGSGDSRISVPIAVPPGVNGLAPQLALTYSSGGGRTEIDARRIPGLLGYGWALSGISEIRRCRIGVSGDVNLTNADRLCLDGQPLVAVNGSTYWSNGAEYRQQQSSEVKVIGHGTGASAWFEVSLADGRRAVYGDTATSRTAPMQGTLPYLWSLRFVEDAFGNQLTVSYHRNDAGGTLYPLAIDYAGARIEFFYNTRSDTEHLVYSATGFVQSAKRMVALSRIAVSVNGIDVREYRIRNAAAVGEEYLHLRDIQVCGYDSAGNNTQCLGPLSFAWSTNSGAPNEFECAVIRLTDGAGAVTEIDYSLVSGASNPLTYPESPFGSPSAPANTAPVSASRRVVSELRQPDGLGGFLRTTYRYKSVPLTSTDNRGYVGFGERRVTRHDVPAYDASGVMTVHDVTTYYQYRLDYPFVGQVSRQLDVLDDDVTTPSKRLSYIEQAWDAQSLHGGTVIVPFLARSMSETYEDGAVISASETEHELCFRAVSNGTCPTSGTILEHPTQVVTSTKTGTGLTSPSFSPAFWGDVPDRSVTDEQGSSERKSSLENVPSEWIIGFVDHVSVTLDTPAGAPVTRSTEYTRVPGTRRIESRVGFPQDPDLELMVFNSFDLNGNLSQIQISGQDVPLRTETVSGYVDQRYPLAVTNAEGHTTTLDFDARFGALDEVTNDDGLTTSSSRDAFGRVVSVDHPDGTLRTVGYEAYDSCSNCAQVAWAAVATVETVSAENGGVQVAPTVRVYRDVLGREVLRETEAFSPTDGWVRVESHFNTAGRMVKASLPYFSNGGTPAYLNVKHDVLGRPVREERPDGGVTATAYDGSLGQLTVTVTETVKTPGQADVTRAKRSSFDARGLLISTTDAFGTSDAVTTTYAYDSALNLSGVTVGGQSVATMQYDAAGRRTVIDEVNTGTTTFDFDALGRLRSQTNAKGQVTTFDYDDLDRLTERVDDAGTGSATTRYWSWDPLNATGALASRSRAGFTETLSYDSLGRLEQVMTDISMDWAGFPGSGSFVVDITYDAAGRLSTVTWPSGFTATRDYTTRGYLAAVRQGATVLEVVEAVDAYGQVTRSGFGNGLATVRGFDVFGRITSIQTGPSTLPKSIQDLEYTWRSNSTLYQRRDYQGTSSTSDDVLETFSYDHLDRLTAAATDHPTGARLLAFGYDALGNLTSKTSSVGGDLSVTGYQYNGPHRLTSAVIDGVVTSFVYDATGNIIRYVPATGDETVIQYDARGDIRKITVGSTEDEFWYGPDGERFLKRSSWDDDGTPREEWTLYLGGYEEVHPVSDPQVLYRQQVKVTDTVIHRRTVDPTFAASSAIEYRHRDHLGSVDKITDEAGNLVLDLAFDPFGSRRNADWTRDLIPAGLELVLGPATTTQRGFTDHEHLDRTGFIHMNGRVYDPRVGRFLQPDPIVQALTFSQSYNRYAYVLNSPLSFTDPSGFKTKNHQERCEECNINWGYLNDLVVRVGPCIGCNLLREWQHPPSAAKPAKPAPDPSPPKDPPSDPPPEPDPEPDPPPEEPPFDEPTEPPPVLPTLSERVAVPPAQGSSQSANLVDDLVADSIVGFFFRSALAADPSRSGSLPVYDGDELIIDAAEADEILDFFFGKGRPALDQIGDLDRSFAQALYIEGLERTQQVGWIEDLFRSKGSIPKLGVRLGRRFLKSEDGQINISVQRVLTDRFDEEYRIRAYTGQYPSYGRNQ